MIIKHYLDNLTILTFLGFYGRSAKYSFVEILRKSCSARILWPAAEAGELAQTAKENTVNCETAYLKSEKSAGSFFGIPKLIDTCTAHTQTSEVGAELSVLFRSCVRARLGCPLECDLFNGRPPLLFFLHGVSSVAAHANAPEWNHGVQREKESSAHRTPVVGFRREPDQEG